MNQIISELSVETKGDGFTDITISINKWITKNKIKQGILLVFAKHTSCSLIINENADPRVLEDLSSYIKALVPEEGFRRISGKGEQMSYLHSEEGPDDMPAHIKTALTSSSLSLSIENYKILLGTWQAIYLWEHRDSKQTRIISLHAMF